MSRVLGRPGPRGSASVFFAEGRVFGVRMGVECDGIARRRSYAAAVEDGKEEGPRDEEDVQSAAGVASGRSAMVLVVSEPHLSEIRDRVNGPRVDGRRAFRAGLGRGRRLPDSGGHLGGTRGVSLSLHLFECLAIKPSLVDISKSGPFP